MKILYVITKANWGGAQRYVYDLATAAQAAGDEAAVAYGEDGELAQRLTAAGIRTIGVPNLKRDVGSILDELRALRELRALFRHERPDVIHINSSKAGFIGALAVPRNVRAVFTAHGWVFNEDRPWWQRGVFFCFAWATICLSDRTICVSEAVRRDTRRMPFVRRKLVVIHNGVHEPAYKNREEARRALWPGYEERVWVGMLSELHPIKRIEDAIAAMREVPGARLVILGEGETRIKLERLIAERALGERVRLAGFVPEGASYLRAFDLFLHTSRSEALAYAVIEAGFAALPVVATNVGGIPEIIEDGRTGLLVASYSPTAIATALNTLLNDRDRARKLGEALAASCRARFGIEHMEHETLALYQR